MGSVGHSCCLAIIGATILLTVMVVPAPGQGWQPLASGLDGPVFCLAVYGDELYAGGSFTMAGGVSASNVARWNGSTWSPAGAGTNDTVHTLFVHEGFLYAGGSFTACGGLPCNAIARWDGAAWSPVGTGVNGPVRAMTGYLGTLYAGGDFTMAGSVPVGRVAALDGEVWRDAGLAVRGDVRALAMTAGSELFADLFAGGTFTGSGFSRVSWFHPAYRTWLVTDWSGFNGPVFTFANSARGLVAGGSFSANGNGAPLRNLALRGFDLAGGTDGPVHALLADGAQLYAGGDFQYAGTPPGIPASHCARWNGNTWEALGSGLNRSVRALTMYRGRPYAGGAFTMSGATPVRHIARWDGAGALPAPGENRVAYYVFDSGGPDRYPMTSFTDEANIVVVFEGTLWELADSAHYATTWMRNVNYHSHAEVLRDIKALQARGVKVLMNVDDAASWSTATPFTTWDGRQLSAEEFALFIKTCAIDSVGLDGISLDVEHGATGNAAYIALLKEIGKHFGPLSANAGSQMYIAAIYSGAAPGPVIGKSREITAYMNFIMDMAYFNSNHVNRFRQWADSIGASKTMIGVLNDFNSVTFARQVAAWQPARPPKAGIMVYAANNLKSYTDSVFRALVVGPGVATMPFPPDKAASVSLTALLSWRGDPRATAHAVYLGTAGTLEAMGEQADTVFQPGALEPNTTYYWRVDERNAVGTTIGDVWTFTTGTGTAVDPGGDGTPEGLALLQNYPNPFNAGTVIRFRIGGNTPRRVKLAVTDMLGREVVVLLDAERAPGEHLVRFDARGLASGVYVYRLQAGSALLTRTCALVR